MNEITVILPTYNEKEMVEEAILTLSKFLPLAEIIVVDDNSPDETARLVADLANNHSNLKLIQRKVRGLAEAIAAGIASAGGNIVLWLDCDSFMPENTIRDLIASLKDGYDIAIASRYVPGGQDARKSKLRCWASRFTNSFARRLLLSEVGDLTSGFVASRKEVFNRVKVRGDYGEYCIDFLIRAQRMGLKVKEIPYKCLDRRRGKTKTAGNPFAFFCLSLKYFWMILKLKLCRKDG